MSKRALITGVTGQDGSYLAEYLLNNCEDEYEVFGLIRRVSTPNLTNIQHLINNSQFHLIEGDITDITSLIKAFSEIMPDEIYNLAAQSNVGISWRQPLLTANTTGIGALNVFEAAYEVCPATKIVQASSSEMFPGDGKIKNEKSEFKPKSVYGTSKLFAHQTARVYRESYGMHISSAISFNHESPRRSVEFVTQKIVTSAVKQHFELQQNSLQLGNISTKRDWSHAKDVVEGIYLLMQYPSPGTYVFASGEAHSVQEFIDAVYNELGMPLKWESNKDGFPYAYNKDRILVQSIPELYRPNEVNYLIGDASKARNRLKWSPKFSFYSLIADMVTSKIRQYMFTGGL